MTTQRPAWTQASLMKTSGSYWEAFALHTALDLDVFTWLGRGAWTPEEIAAGLGCSTRGLGMLCDVLSAMGLLTVDKGRYANSEESRALLDRNSPGYVGHILLHHAHLVDGWSRLTDAVRVGRPTRKDAVRNAAGREAFLLGMHTLATAIAPRVAEHLPLQGKSRLLDLGGGPGTYAIHFCLKTPGLHAEVYDLPSSRPFAEKTIAAFGLSDRIRFHDADLLTDPISETWDLVWISHVFHSLGEDACRLLVKKAAQALVPGGLLCVHEFLLDDRKTGPLFPALFALNMLVNTEEGKAYTEGEVRRFLEEAGIRDIRRLPFLGPNASGVVLGVCPDR